MISLTIFGKVFGIALKEYKLKTKVMKRLMILNVVIVFTTITAMAQTSRRESSNTRERSSTNTRSVKVESTSKTPSKTSDNRNKSATVSRQTSNSPANNNRTSNTKTVSSNRSAASTSRTNTTARQPVQRGSSTTREINRTTTGSTTTSGRRVNAQPAQRSATTSTRSNTQPVQRTATTTVKREHNGPTRVYHSDVRYVTPRSQVREVRVYNNRPTNHHHHNVIVREPVRRHIVWDVHMHREYREIYPYVRVWRIQRGAPIYTIPSYDAWDYIGDVKRVYGHVREVYYDPRADEYHLYFGDFFPYQDFTAIVPGYIARQITRRPYRYFKNQYMSVTGYISEFDERPEIVVKRNYQIDLY